jgi:hypothetical protein
LKNRDKNTAEKEGEEKKMKDNKKIEKGGKGNKKLKHTKYNKGRIKKRKKLTKEDNKRGGTEDQGSDT